MDSGEIAFWLKNSLANLLLYPTGPILLAAWGLFAWRRRPQAARATLAIGLAMLIVFALPVVVDALAAIDEREFPPYALATAQPAGTAIVVLGGGMQMGALDYGGETVNPTTLARLRAAARLQVATGLPVLVTGGRPLQGRSSEASQMADALTRDFRVPVRWREEYALDTADNARLSAALLHADGFRRALLVTDVSHMRRARTLFVAAGVEVVPVPTDYYATSPVDPLFFVPQGNAIRRSSWVIHEWVGYAWARLRETVNFQ